MMLTLVIFPSSLIRLHMFSIPSSAPWLQWRTPFCFISGSSDGVDTTSTPPVSTQSQSVTVTYSPTNKPNCVISGSSDGVGTTSPAPTTKPVSNSDVLTNKTKLLDLEVLWWGGDDQCPSNQWQWRTHKQNKQNCFISGSSDGVDTTSPPPVSTQRQSVSAHRDSQWQWGRHKQKHCFISGWRGGDHQSVPPSPPPPPPAHRARPWQWGEASTNKTKLLHPGVLWRDGDDQCPFCQHTEPVNDSDVITDRCAEQSHTDNVLSK